MKTYIRDKRSPKPKNASVSKVMSANKGKNTKPELALIELLENFGINNFRLHNNDLPGRPDIWLADHNVAIFLNGCYWHRCPTCELPLPKNNRVFWRKKFERNVSRDRAVRRKLRKLGMKTITIWECKLRTEPQKQMNRIFRYLNIERIKHEIV